MSGEVRVVCERPSRALEGHIAAYVMVDDRAGELPYERVRTVPMPFGALSANFGALSHDGAGQRHPEAAFLGLQTRFCEWVAGRNTLFVMVLLTPLGMMRLLPHTGRCTGNALCDLHGLWSRPRVQCFQGAARAWVQGGVAAVMDRWAAAALAQTPQVAVPLSAALRTYGAPGAAAAALGMSLRSLERHFQSELGVTPTALANLERLQRSLCAVQRSKAHVHGVGFADQAHEIRHWRRYLGTSPGRYRVSGGSRVARAAEPLTDLGAAFYL